MAEGEMAESVHEQLRVLLVEEHRMVAEGLAMLLSKVSGLRVVANVATGDDAEQVARTVEFDVALVDFKLPDRTGPDTAHELRSIRPAANVVMLSADPSEEALLAAVEAGAAGYLLKSGTYAELVDAIRRVAAGEFLIPSQRLAALLLHQRERAQILTEQEKDKQELVSLLRELTQRELDVLELIIAGLDNKSIGRRLGIGTGTVRTHVQHLLHKLGAHSKLEAAAWAGQRGVLTGILTAAHQAPEEDAEESEGRMPAGRGQR
jgi:two-component system, NarL family, nitrate/nitrite response regulator NarL